MAVILILDLVNGCIPALDFYLKIFLLRSILSPLAKLLFITPTHQTPLTAKCLRCTESTYLGYMSPDFLTVCPQNVFWEHFQCLTQLIAGKRLLPFSFFPPGNQCSLFQGEKSVPFLLSHENLVSPISPHFISKDPLSEGHSPQSTCVYKDTRLGFCFEKFSFNWVFCFPKSGLPYASARR